MVFNIFKNMAYGKDIEMSNIMGTQSSMMLSKENDDVLSWINEQAQYLTESALDKFKKIFKNSKYQASPQDQCICTDDDIYLNLASFKTLLINKSEALLITNRATYQYNKQDMKFFLSTDMKNKYCDEYYPSNITSEESEAGLQIKGNLSINDLLDDQTCQTCNGTMLVPEHMEVGDDYCNLLTEINKECFIAQKYFGLVALEPIPNNGAETIKLVRVIIYLACTKTAHANNIDEIENIFKEQVNKESVLRSKYRNQVLQSSDLIFITDNSSSTECVALLDKKFKTIHIIDKFSKDVVQEIQSLIYKHIFKNDYKNIDLSLFFIDFSSLT